MEWRFEERMKGESRTEIVRSAPTILWIDDVLAAVLRIGYLREGVEDSQVDTGTLPGNIIGIDHPVTQITGDSVEIVDATDRGSIGRNAISSEPGTGGVTAQTQISRSYRILLGDGEAGMEQWISTGLRHDAGSPAVYRGGEETGMAQVAGTTGDDRFEQGSWLGSWLDPVLQGGRDGKPLSLCARQWKEDPDQNHDGKGALHRRPGPIVGSGVRFPHHTLTTSYPVTATEPN